MVAYYAAETLYLVCASNLPQEQVYDPDFDDAEGDDLDDLSGIDVSVRESDAPVAAMVPGGPCRPPTSAASDSV